VRVAVQHGQNGLAAAAGEPRAGHLADPVGVPGWHRGIAAMSSARAQAGVVTGRWPGPARLGSMCRSIKTLREPYTEQVTEQDVRAAALQYVRKISGFRAPAAHNAEAFNAAVDAVSRVTAELLDRLEVRRPAAAVRSR